MTVFDAPVPISFVDLSIFSIDIKILQNKQFLVE